MSTLEQRIGQLEREVAHLKRWLVPLPGATAAPGLDDDATLRALCSYMGADHAVIVGQGRPPHVTNLRRLLAQQLQANGWTPARIARAMRKDRKAVVRWL